jgi:hypothetical protein
MEYFAFLDDAPIGAVVDPSAIGLSPGGPAVEVGWGAAAVAGMSGVTHGRLRLVVVGVWRGGAYLLCSNEIVVGVWVGKSVGAEALHDVMLATPGLRKGPHGVGAAAVNRARELLVTDVSGVGVVGGVGVL